MALLTRDMCLGGQYGAIEAVAGAWEVISGPGTGKTTTISNRIAHLVRDQSIDPTRILAVTFNKSAADELKERSTALLIEAGANLEQVDDGKGNLVYTGADVRTYHSAGYLIAREFVELNKFDAVMADATWMAKYILSPEMPPLFKGGETRRGMGWNTETEINVDPKEMCGLMDRMKDNMVLPSEARAYFIEMLGYPEHNDLENYCTFYRLYHKELASKGKLTFADMLFAAWLILTNKPNELKSLYKVKANITDMAFALSKWQQRWDYFIVDEAQDTNPLQGEVMVGLLCRRSGNIMVVGDADQCQPAGTKVLTPNGLIDIADLDPENHRVVSFDRHGQSVVGYKDGYAFRKASRHFHGNLITVSAGGKSTRCTPNHKWLIKWNDSAKVQKTCVVYLMRKGHNFRVGWCQLFNSENTFHLNVRARLEDADDAWILHATTDRMEASVFESYIAARYGIPTITFKQVDGAQHLTQGAIDYTFKMLDEAGVVLYDRALECLVNCGRDINYPIWSACKDRERRGRSTCMVTQACNLLPGLMSIPVPTEKKAMEWEMIDIHTEAYDGLVYSLDVDKYEMYIADGLITHNSIYKFRGAQPTYIQSLMDRYYPERHHIFLDHTRRFTQEIVDVANKLIANNPRLDHYSPLKTARSDAGTVGVYDFGSEGEQAYYFAQQIIESMERDAKGFDDFGIIARTNATIAMIEPVLFANKIMYRVLGGGSVYNRKEVRVTMGFVAAMTSDPMLDEVLACFNIAGKFNTKGTHYLGAAAEDVVRDKFAENRGIAPMNIISMILNDRSVKAYMKRGLGEWSDLVYMMRCEAKDLAEDEQITSLGYVRAAREMAVDAYVIKQYGEKEDDGDSRFEVLIGLEHLAAQYPNVEEFLNVVRQLQADAAKPKDEQSPAVRLGTAHRWKGLEADTIFIASMNDSVFPHKRSEGYTENMPVGYGAEGIREERRLAFVAVTRGKNHVVIGKMGRSLFCEEMGLVTVATPEVEEEELVAIGSVGNEYFNPFSGDIYADMDAVAEELDWLKSGFGDDNYISPECEEIEIAADGAQEDIAALDNLDLERGLAVAVLEDPTLPVPAITRPEHEILTVRGITDLFDPTLPVPPITRPGMEGEAAQASFPAPITPVKKTRKPRSKKSIA